MRFEFNYYRLHTIRTIYNTYHIQYILNNILYNDGNNFYINIAAGKSFSRQEFSREMKENNIKELKPSKTRRKITADLHSSRINVFLGLLIKLLIFFSGRKNMQDKSEFFNISNQRTDLNVFKFLLLVYHLLSTTNKRVLHFTNQRTVSNTILTAQSNVDTIFTNS